MFEEIYAYHDEICQGLSQVELKKDNLALRSKPQRNVGCFKIFAQYCMRGRNLETANVVTC